MVDLAGRDETGSQGELTFQDGSCARAESDASILAGLR